MTITAGRLLLILALATGSQPALAQTRVSDAALPSGPYAKAAHKFPRRLQAGLDRVADAMRGRSLASAAELQREFPQLKFGQSAKGSALLAVDLVAKSRPAALADRLASLGAQNLAVHGRMVSARVPTAALSQLELEPELLLARPARAVTRRGRVTSQGDFALRAPSVRPPAVASGPTGAGIDVGVLSDSFDCLADSSFDVANDEYSPVTVLSEEVGCASGTDEGRAMVQIVADVAPESTQSFYSAFNGEADFANGILDLAANGSDVIVDDIIYFTEPFFHDGIVAQAADAVVAQGVPFFTAAGNNGRASYESEFRRVNNAPKIFRNSPPVAHDFDPGSAVDVAQDIGIPAGSSISLAFQWDDPFISSSPASPGADGDVDIFLIDGTGKVVAAADEFSVGGDAVEILDFVNETGSTQTFFLHVRVFSDDATPLNPPGRIKYVNFGSEDVSFEYATNSGTAVGHPSAAGAFAVGAAAYFETPRCGVNPPLLEPFSSAGGTPILMRPNGNLLPSPLIREKPDAVGPDGANTSFFGDDITNPGGPGECLDEDRKRNFFGTSAAAPHVAGVAALMREVNPSASPATLYQALRKSAQNMGPAGFDFDTGHGLVRADLAVAAVTPPTVNFTRTRRDVSEGARAIVDVTLSKTSGDRVVVTLGIGGSATSGTDYVEPTLRLVFKPGATSQRVIVQTTQDSSVEDDETAILRIDSAKGASIGSASRFRTTIVDDD